MQALWPRGPLTMTCWVVIQFSVTRVPTLAYMAVQQRGLQ
jgi:hypothetical protein